MGQGFSLATPSAGAATIDVPELSDLQYERAIGGARFMKCVRARHHDGVVLVKILVKPYVPMPLERYRKEILSEWTAGTVQTGTRPKLTRCCRATEGTRECPERPRLSASLRDRDKRVPRPTVPLQLPLRSHEHAPIPRGH